MKSPRSLSLIFDGQCRFCIRVLKVISAFDVGGRLRFHDTHREETFVRFPELRNAEVQDAMYTIANNELLYRGFFAFRRLIWGVPLLWPLVVLFYFPGASVLGPRLYAWIARNRKRLGCNPDFCDLHTARQGNL